MSGWRKHPSSYNLAWTPGIVGAIESIPLCFEAFRHSQAVRLVVIAEPSWVLPNSLASSLACLCAVLAQLSRDFCEWSSVARIGSHSIVLLRLRGNNLKHVSCYWDYRLRTVHRNYSVLDTSIGWLEHVLSSASMLGGRTRHWSAHYSNQDSEDIWTQQPSSVSFATFSQILRALPTYSLLQRIFLYRVFDSLDPNGNRQASQARLVSIVPLSSSQILWGPHSTPDDAPFRLGVPVPILLYLSEPRSN
ncbi:hypothetical protein AcV5_000324 [Taiwanofungus camphoratus]|nr:hypothetical protein AcV5_000324 [Antrodia cinnamomea]